jgi:transcriptional regulator with XRE-family HTH domain
MSESTQFTGRQIAAGRTLAGISQADLAMAASVSVPTLRRMEASEGPASGLTNNVAAVRRALESAGVIFVAENGDGPGVRLRKQRDDRANLDSHIEHLEGEVAGLKSQVADKPSPATGMAMLRKARAKNELTTAKNKRAKAPK